MDNLTSLVNEVKTMISLCGMVKSAVGEAFREIIPVIHSSNEPSIPTDRLENRVHDKKDKRSMKKKKKRQASGQ